MQIRIHPDHISGISIPRHNDFIYDVKTAKLLLGDGVRTVLELLSDVPHQEVQCEVSEKPCEVHPTEETQVFTPGDVNEDGKVDEEDLSIVHTEYAKEVKKKTPRKKSSKKKKD